ncbi:unnamed protein product [Tilletia controversa]|uniref:Uncharacterized protein n=3 Tax=Tilletia TaxID=13289 RepID=A0A8X7MJ96_9BASI|nr:hypothetical protein CF328_g8156 [Tilletia controversa]KAE8199881.1 hypothetical protein CF336_g981 [Tilletia laevis]KAE8242599.1 hypothetical protein A4X03_0g8001 [Tilletia caries]KAE8208114.1 hypothetical protein CF335_g643 [Tilletia laevis]KAE8238329.1 hypothetical protein A4X06_0g8857 [Tilletia controversa]
MASISFYVPPPTPTPLPPNRPAALRDSHRAQALLQHNPAIQLDTLPEHVKEALAQLEQKTRLRTLTIVQEDDEEDDEDEDATDQVKITTYKLTMQAGQRLTLLLYLGSPQASHHANTYATLLRALHHLTAPIPTSSPNNDNRHHHHFQTPLRILAPLAIFECAKCTAVVLEDLGATLNLPTSSSSPERSAGNAIRASAPVQASGRLQDVLSPSELAMLQSHILENMDDLPLPSHITTSRTHQRIARLQVIPTSSSSSNGSSSLKAGSQRKDSAVAGLGYSPESVFRTTDLEEAGRRSRATRTFETSPERNGAGPDEEGMEVAEMLVDIELLCHPSTRTIRLAQGAQTLYLELHPAAVRRLTTVQLLRDRP